MNIIEDQSKTRNNISPRNLAAMPLSLSVITREDIIRQNETRLDAELERQWVRSVNNHQFWAFQYIEHVEMIALIISSLGHEFERYVKEANDYTKLWDSIYKGLITDNNKRIDKLLLDEFRAFKLTLLQKLMKTDWIGWAPLTLYEHMIREVEYIQTPLTAVKIISFWLTDMEGHATLDACWTDPAHEELVKKAKEIADAYKELKKAMGEKEGEAFFNLLKREEEDINDDGKQFGPKNISGDLGEVLTRLTMLQNGLTNFHLEYKILYDNGKLFTTMPASLISHTLRESMRANYELEELSNGRIVS